MRGWVPRVRLLGSGIPQASLHLGGLSSSVVFGGGGLPKAAAVVAATDTGVLLQCLST